MKQNRWVDRDKEAVGGGGNEVREKRMIFSVRNATVVL